MLLNEYKLIPITVITEALFIYKKIVNTDCLFVCLFHNSIILAIFGPLWNNFIRLFYSTIITTYTPIYIQSREFYNP